MVFFLSIFWFDIRAPARVNTRSVYCIYYNFKGFGSWIAGMQSQAAKSIKTNGP
jgi:hypothetical protein